MTSLPLLLRAYWMEPKQTEAKDASSVSLPAVDNAELAVEFL